ncbi:aldolase/citrate lyase family protein [Comamonas sp. BIGb0124]|uniref:aldolase/citrate lyase family protein n=1 Tax=Comamonas sp. BIGb0124 TaxID=2485130 RepID=UPI000F46391B|nr:aldolase/citrate lyase family protein [Comamonas sp. BIGb0124]
MADTTGPLADARSLLFVPGNRPERFDKAAHSGADAVVLDLEDAVAPADKAVERADIEAAWSGLQGASLPLVIRINTVDQPLGADDLQWLATLSRPSAVMMPKVESVAALARV